MKDIVGTKFKLDIKLYNGVYTDNWIILSIILDLNDITDSLEVTDSCFKIISTISAKLSYGKYYDVLLEKKCKVDNLMMKFDLIRPQKEGLRLHILNTTCMSRDHV